MKRFLCLAALGVLLSTAAHAQTVADKIDPASLPPPLLDALIMGANNQKDDFISWVNLLIAQYSRSKISLDQKDIDAFIQRRNDKASQDQIKQYKSYDTNSDNIVTKDEASLGWLKMAKERNFHPFQYGGMQKSASRKFDALDSDGNRKLTINEMGVVKIEPHQFSNDSNAELDSLVAFLKMDPDKDGVLTIEELSILASDAFDLVDQDQNGMLSREEISPLSKARDNALFEEEFGDADRLRKLVEDHEKANPQ